jgi:photosystem II stability/assembly factor-like uncharacterized protein
MSFTLRRIFGALAFLAVLTSMVHARPLQAAGRWQELGPDGGMATELAVDPFNPANVLAGTTTAGLFRSGNRGTTWRAVGAAPNARVGAIVFDPRHAGTAYAGTADPVSSTTHVLKTTDGGETWTPSDTGLIQPAFFGITSLAIDPRRPAVLYASPGYATGVFKTGDGGATWAASGLEGLFVYAVVVDPTSSTVFAGTSSGVFRSLDGGATWTPRGLTKGIVALALAPGVPAGKPQTLYAGGDGLYCSTDGGAHWRSIRRGLPTKIVAAVAVHPRFSSVLYVALPELTDGTAGRGGLFRSVDGGASWQALGQGLPARGALAVAIDPRAPSRVYAGLAGEGLFRSVDGGIHWTAARGGLHALTVQRVTGSGAPGHALYAGPTVRGVFQYTSPGWLLINGRVHSDSTGRVAVGDALYAGVAGRLERSDDGGLHWLRIDGGLGGAEFRGPIAVDPVHPGTLYAGTLFDLFKSTDHGEHWQASVDGLGCTDPVRVDVSPADPSLVFVSGLVHLSGECETGGGGFRSPDGGVHWELLGSIGALTPHPADPAIVYALTFSEVMKSTDGGATFAPAGAPGSSPPRPTVLAVDRNHPATVYAGTFGQGVFVSDDAGATWEPFGEGLTGTVFDLEIDSFRLTTLYAGTSHGAFSIFLEDAQ